VAIVIPSPLQSVLGIIQSLLVELSTRTGIFFIHEDHPSGENPSEGIPPTSWTVVVRNPNPEKINPEHIDLGVYCANIKP
jgi:hypothetical protein